MTRVADAVICENPLYFAELEARRPAVHRQVGPVDSRRYQAQRGVRTEGAPINVGWTGSVATFEFIRRKHIDVRQQRVCRKRRRREGSNVARRRGGRFTRLAGGAGGQCNHSGRQNVAKVHQAHPQET